MSFEKPENFQPYTLSPEDAKAMRPLTEEERKELGVGEKIEKKSRPEMSVSRLSTVFQNPENLQEQTIEINLEEILKEQGQFYKNNLNLDINEINESAVREIWNRNYAEIQKEIETYGYDSILIIPNDLPEEEILNRDLVETMDEGAGKGKVAATYQGDNFKNDGKSFAGVKNTYSPKYRLVLTHSDQNIYKNTAANPFLKATLGKNIMGLTGLAPKEVQKRIDNGQELPVNFETEFKGQKIQIQAEGLSLEEYQVLQRMYFEKNKKHLDESGWSWLSKSFSGSRVVLSSWLPGVRRLVVDADDPGDADDNLGLRLSRSFS